MLQSPALLGRIFLSIGRITITQLQIAMTWLFVAAAMLLLWPLLIALGGMFSPSIAIILVPVLTILPFFVLIGSAIFLTPIIIVGIIGGSVLSKTGQKILACFCAIIGAEILMGIYFAMVPTANDRPLIPLLLLFFLGLCFFRKKGGVRKFLIFNVVILTAVFFLGGRTEVQKKINGVGSEISSTSTPTPVNDRVPATYVREACTDVGHTKVIPIADLVPPEDRDLPIGTRITIPLHEGCFANTYVLPANRIYWAQKSKIKGDWAVPWCNGSPEPPLVVQPYYLDMEHTLDNCYAHGRELPFLHDAADTSPHFSLQGRGTITFIVTANKTVFY